MHWLATVLMSVGGFVGLGLLFLLCHFLNERADGEENTGLKVLYYALGMVVLNPIAWFCIAMAALILTSLVRGGH